MKKQLIIISLLLISFVLLLFLLSAIIVNSKEGLESHPQKLAFYTCFYGDGTNIAFKIPEIPSHTYPCYYFTNNEKMMESLGSTHWIPVFDSIKTNGEIESAMAAKKPKALPMSFPELSGYEYLCYFDSKLTVNESSVFQEINTYPNTAMIIQQHDFLKDVLSEFIEAMKYPRYRAEKSKYKAYMKKQLALGLKASTPKHAKTGYIIRNMKHKRINEIDKTWYQHIKECGIECQISFFFVKQLFPSTDITII
jgi:hypothetical protein